MKTTHFGYQQIPLTEKASKVAKVFTQVVDKYDVMNDLMSFGLHRWWKRFAVALANVRPNDQVLDLAGGTGDLTLAISKKLNTGQVFLADINQAMLQAGRDRLLDQGLLNAVMVQADAEQLPFKDNYFDIVVIAFGLRNVTDQLAALASMYRVLKPGGQALILEFSRPVANLLTKVYDAYSFSVLPALGKLVANDAESYRYLAESIRMHPAQTALLAMLDQTGFANTRYHNLAGGIVALHRGYKF